MDALLDRMEALVGRVEAHFSAASGVATTQAPPALSPKEQEKAIDDYVRRILLERREE